MRLDGPASWDYDVPVSERPSPENIIPRSDLGLDSRVEDDEDAAQSSSEAPLLASTDRDFSGSIRLGEMEKVDGKGDSEDGVEARAKHSEVVGEDGFAVRHGGAVWETRETYGPAGMCVFWDGVCVECLCCS